VAGRPLELRDRLAEPSAGLLARACGEELADEGPERVVLVTGPEELAETVLAGR
jgi:hypothetical protein